MFADHPFSQAIAQFNAGEYYACHDTLEALWIEALEPDRKFYQGLLQIAVAYYHLSHHNWRGCVILLGEGIAKLQAFAPTYADINVETFLALNQANLQQLHALGSERMAEFSWHQIPQVDWMSHDE